MSIVAIVMGSHSDLDTMQSCADTLDNLGIAYSMEVISAHRTPDLMLSFAEHAKSRGIEIIIAGAGGAAHLPGMIAAKTPLPVLGVPIKSKVMSGLDSLYSIVQMPGGVPVATFSIGKAGAINAALFAARILSNKNKKIAERLNKFIQEQTQSIMEDRILK